jgi:hypothetical protein
MGQKQIKTVKRAAEKTAKAMALELAKAQLLEIANSPFKIRWQFCRAILFPKKLRVSADAKAGIQKIAHGGMNEQLKNDQRGGQKDAGNQRT